MTLRAALIAFAIVMLFMWMSGCIARQEIREQHCATVALDRHGAHRPAGAYGTATHGDRCFCRLWDGHLVDEGRLDDHWRPE